MPADANCILSLLALAYATNSIMSLTGRSLRATSTSGASTVNPFRTKSVTELSGGLLNSVWFWACVPGPVPSRKVSPVRGSLRARSAPFISAGAADVFNDNGLAQNFSHALREQPRQHVVWPARRKQIDHRERSRRPFLRLSRRSASINATAASSAVMIRRHRFLPGFPVFRRTRSLPLFQGYAGFGFSARSRSASVAGAPKTESDAEAFALHSPQCTRRCERDACLRGLCDQGGQHAVGGQRQPEMKARRAGRSRGPQTFKIRPGRCRREGRPGSACAAWPARARPPL